VLNFADEEQLSSEKLKNSEENSGQYTMAPFQIVSRDGPECKGICGMGKDGDCISIVSVFNNSLSRGSMHLNSSDPKVQPTVDPEYFAHSLDLELHGRHAQWLETLSATEPMAALLRKYGRSIHQEKSVTDLETAERVVEGTFISHYHVTVTYSMLPKELGGVVNDILFAYEVSNLRIVDASIFPMIPRGNIKASVYAVAE